MKGREPSEVIVLERRVMIQDFRFVSGKLGDRHVKKIRAMMNEEREEA